MIEPPINETMFGLVLGNPESWWCNDTTVEIRQIRK